MRTRIAILAAAVLAAAFLLALLPLPEPTLLMPPGIGPATQTAIGAIHIHTSRSDGSGSIEDVAAAAARAGLHFIIITDHGDGTRAPEPPQYRSGVLVIDAVELSTSTGHYIAVGIPQTPYPLRGEARDVVEDVKRLNGFGIVAHPHSAKPNLRWSDWSAPFDAIEWLNADTEWRDEGVIPLARALARYPFRPVETLASLLDRPDQTLARWDALTQQRRVVALPGADAHARGGFMDDDANGYRRNWFLRIPSYEASFRTFAMRVDLKEPLSRDPRAASAEIVSVLKAGQVYSAVDALATPAILEFTASEPLDARVSFAARSNAASGGVIVLRKNGRIVQQHPLPELKFETPREEATYRVEVYLSNAPGDPPVPWIVSNPIYIRPPGWGTVQPVIQSDSTDAHIVQGGPWHTEKDDGSDARVNQRDAPKGPVEFTYRLADGERRGQYSALGISVGNALTDRTRIRFRAHASRPMRISVQARRPRSGERWQRSIYLDTQPRDVIVSFTDMRAVDSEGRFDPSLVDTVLFVVDTVNTLPGTAGNFWIGDLRVER